MSVKIDWSKITDNVAVNCRTEEEAEIFVGEACKKHPGNVRNWLGGSRWGTCPNGMLYSVEKNKKLVWGEESFFTKEGYTILPFSDILIQEPVERDQTAKADKGEANA